MVEHNRHQQQPERSPTPAPSGAAQPLAAEAGAKAKQSTMQAGAAETGLAASQQAPVVAPTGGAFADSGPGVPDRHRCLCDIMQGCIHSLDGCCQCNLDNAGLQVARALDCCCRFTGGCSGQPWGMGGHWLEPYNDAQVADTIRRLEQFWHRVRSSELALPRHCLPTHSMVFSLLIPMVMFCHFNTHARVAMCHHDPKDSTSESFMYPSFCRSLVMSSHSRKMMMQTNTARAHQKAHQAKPAPAMVSASTLHAPQ